MFKGGDAKATNECMRWVPNLREVLKIDWQQKNSFSFCFSLSLKSMCWKHFWGSLLSKDYNRIHVFFLELQEKKWFIRTIETWSCCVCPNFFLDFHKKKSSGISGDKSLEPNGVWSLVNLETSWRVLGDLHQWLFLVPIKGGIGGIVHPPIGSIYHLYTTYSPCLLGGYMLPTTF